MFLPPVVLVFIEIHMMGCEKHMYNALECTMAIQGHMMLLILTPVESACVISY